MAESIEFPKLNDITTKDGVRIETTSVSSHGFQVLSAMTGFVQITEEWEPGIVRYTVTFPDGKKIRHTVKEK